MVPGDLKEGRIVIVGASLAGSRASATLREKVVTDSLTVVEDAGGWPTGWPRGLSACW